MTDEIQTDVTPEEEVKPEVAAEEPKAEAEAEVKPEAEAVEPAPEVAE